MPPPAKEEPKKNPKSRAKEIQIQQPQGPLVEELGKEFLHKPLSWNLTIRLLASYQLR